MSEKPGGTSAPSSSTVEAGMVEAGVTVAVAGSVAVRCGWLVSVGGDEAVACGDEGGSTVTVAGWQADSVITINARNLLNRFSSYPICTWPNYLNPSNRSVSMSLPPFTRLKAL